MSQCNKRRAFTYADDGRLTSTTEADGGRKIRCYVDGAGQELAGDCSGSEDVDRLSLANLTRIVHRATTSEGAGSASYESTSEDLSYQGDNILTSASDGRGRPMNLPVPVADESSSLGFPADGVGGSYRFDEFGRLSDFSGNGSGGPTGRFHYGESHDGTQGAGLVRRFEQGGGTLWKELEYDDAYNVDFERTSHGTYSRTTFDNWDRPVRVVSGRSDGRLSELGTAACGEGFGARMETAYDAAGHVVRERSLQDFVDAAGDVKCRWVETAYTYNAREQVTDVAMSHLASATTAGAVFGGLQPIERREYDGFGRLERQIAVNSIDADLVTRYRYDEAGRTAGVSVGASGEQLRGYDRKSRVARTTDGDEGVWLGRYDIWDRIWYESHATGAYVLRRFDEAHNPLEETTWNGDPLGTGAELLSRVESEFNSFGEAARVVEYLSVDEVSGSQELRVTERDFDGSGRTFAVWSGPPIEGTEVLDRSQARREMSYTYEAEVGRVLVTAFGGDAAEGPLFAHRNVYYVENKAPWPDEMDYLEAVPGEDLLVETSSARYVRDALGRVIREDYSTGSLMLTTYDRGGGPIRTQSGSGATTSMGTDSRGLPVRMIRPNNRGETRYAYDRDGRLRRQEVTHEGAEPWQTVYGYDTTGRVTTIEHADGSVEGFTYHADNVIATRTTRDGIQFDMSYDAANRLLGVVPSLAGPLPESLAPLDSGESFSYDELSRPLSMQRAGDASLTVAIPQYDLASRPQQEVVGGRDPLRWTWDTWNRPTGLELPAVARPQSGGFTGYTRAYDTLDRIVDLGTQGPLSAGATAGATWNWGGGRLYAMETKMPLHTGVRYGYIEGRGPPRPNEEQGSASKWQLGTLTWGGAAEASTDPLAVPAEVWGQFAFGYRGNDGDPRENSAILKRNMGREGRHVRDDQAAAHIVASTGRKRQWAPASRSREILERYQIDINDAANGILIGHPRPHNITHSGDFHKMVEKRLSNVIETMKAKSYGQRAIRISLRRELRTIGNDVLKSIQ